MDTCWVFCKALKVPFARSTTFLYFSLLSQDVQRACQRTDQFRPCFEQWAQIQFLCSSIYHFVCYVSAWSLTKVAIVLEGHFFVFSFLLLLKASVLHTGKWVYDRYVSPCSHNNRGSAVQMRQFASCLQAIVVKMRWKGENKLIACYSKPTRHMAVFNFFACSTFHFFLDIWVVLANSQIGGFK